jgi:hypothetical protein
MLSTGAPELLLLTLIAWLVLAPVILVLRGIPLLDAAAVDAVRQWEYTPTLLNGVPVPVIMTVTVNFKLA